MKRDKKPNIGNRYAKGERFGKFLCTSSVPPINSLGYSRELRYFEVATSELSIEARARK